MPSAAANGIELYYESFGDDADPPLLLVMGLGAQMLSWDEAFCFALVDRGFRVVRFDNRDVGLSSWVTDPYTLSDMAADAVGLLDHLGIARAHVVGASLGGMIAQTIAIEHPARVLTLTSIMSTTGEPDVGQPTPAAMQRLLTPPAGGRAGAIESSVAGSRVIGSPEHFDEDRVRAMAAAAYDRASNPAGTVRQLLAIGASGSRADGLRALVVPTLVIHGDADPLVTPSGGRRTAELVPGADLLILEGMGHDLPLALWPAVVEAITNNARRATSP